MINLTLKKAKSQFFDRAKVKNAMDKTARKKLSRLGAFTRTRSRSSIRYSKKVSAPGRPPHGHRTMQRNKTNKKTGVTKMQSVSPLREFIFFAWDDASKSVVIGPVRLNNKSGKSLRALEQGGRSEVKLGGKMVAVTIRARPFMGPAFREELKKLPPAWRNSLRE